MTTQDWLEYYLPDNVNRLRDNELTTETEYMMREAAAIDRITGENQEYAGLVTRRLDHLLMEVKRRENIARYKPVLGRVITPEKIQDIKERLPLDRFFANLLELRKLGANLVGHCPLHPDRHPSFTVYVDHYYCFGCGAGGDIFSWLMQVNSSLSFIDAVHLAAQMAGIEVGKKKTGPI